MKRQVEDINDAANNRHHGVYIEKLADENREFFLKKGRLRSYSVVTFGCQMNAHDSEKLEKFFFDMGYEKAEDEFNADVVVYNTCCVRENAENRVYGNLGYLKHLKQEGREFKIIVCGCMTQQGTVIDKIKNSHRHVDVILGTFNLHRLPQLLWTSMETNGQIIDVWSGHEEAEPDLPFIREKQFKAGVNIMYGCNNFCTYCIVPYVRGRERSRSAGDILAEVKELADDGVKEILLLGQNVNSYKSGEGLSFAGLLHKISGTEKIERIRFMTSHPKDLSGELIEEMRTNRKICRSLHLPFQSGSTRILEKMNRRYTKDGYLALVDKIKTAIPDIALTTDIIVGFPGETEEDFSDTLDIIRKVRFSGAYTFLYSKRTGTPAAEMDDQIPEEIAKERFDRLLSALNPIIHEENVKQVGTTARVLAEDINGDGILSGRSDNNTIVHFKGKKELVGQFIDVKITDCKTFYCVGEVVD